MGGANKPLLEWRDKRIIDHVVERVAPQVDAIYVSANQNISTYQAYGTVLTDPPEFTGPLAGVWAGLTGTDLTAQDLLFVCPGDAPLIPIDLVQAMHRLVKPNVHAVVAHDGKRAQNLHLLLKPAAIGELEAYLLTAERSAWRWLQTLRKNNRLIECHYPTTDGFTNLNYPADFEA